MKEIPLTQGKVALVDDGDYANLSKYKWNTHQNCRTQYAERTVCIGGKPRTIKMHAAIMNTPPGMETDHINGDGLDNRRENLRVVTTRQNQQNQRGHKSSRFPGVYWNKAHQKWLARIRVNGKSQYLGYFDEEIAAFTAYKLAVEQTGDQVVGAPS